MKSRFNRIVKNIKTTLQKEWQNHQGGLVRQVSGKCNLRCENCQLWPNPNPTIDSKIKEKIQKNAKIIFKDHKKDYHIVGGDPFENDALVPVLKQIKENQKTIILWTHGQVPIDKWLAITPYIDKVYLYVSVPDREEWSLRTGHDGYQESQNAIQLLKEKQIEVVLNYPINPANVEFLPDIYEWAHQENLHCLFHYKKTDPFTGDSIPLIHRFAQYNKCTVWIKEKNHPYCPSICLEETKNGLPRALQKQLTKRKVKKIIKTITKK